MTLQVKKMNELIEIQDKQAAILERFKAGDIVAPYFTTSGDFYGIVVSVNKVEFKVYVDFNGTLRQFDPSDIRIVLKQMCETKPSERSPLLEASSREALYYIESPRKFKVTSDEQENGIVKCPRCKGEMVRENFTRDQKLFRCPECQFKVPHNDIVAKESIANKIASEIVIAEKLVAEEAFKPLRLDVVKKILKAIGAKPEDYEIQGSNIMFYTVDSKGEHKDDHERIEKLAEKFGDETGLSHTSNGSMYRFNFKRAPEDKGEWSDVTSKWHY